jgi:sugar/nucleoside kinase (ribokinase family)
VAQALGCRTLIVTSAGPDFAPAKELPGLTVKIVPAADTTTFENVYTAEGRQQYLYKRAGCIEAADIPLDWRRAEIVHLGPLDMEFDPTIIEAFPSSKVGITPQGWLRKWDENGKVAYKSWSPDPAVLAKAAVVIVSEEDFPLEESLQPYIENTPIFIQTRGVEGCVVYQRGSAHYYSAPTVEAVNLTGAGDTFATAFLVRLHQTDSFSEAADFANYIAAWSITGNTLPEKITIIKQKLGDYSSAA